MYKTGEIIKTKITNITHYGFFVEAEEGWKGLVHISEISENYVYNVEDHFTRGQVVDVAILSIDNEKRQLSCSYKQANKNEIETKKFDSQEDFNSVEESLDKSLKYTLDKMEDKK